MKILLIKPPQNPNLATGTLYEPLELEYLAASVKDHDVRILDMRIDRNLKRELNHFRPAAAGLTGYTTDYNTVLRLLREIKNFDPGIRTFVGGNHATFSPDDFASSAADAVFTGYADSTFPEYLNSIDDPAKLRMIPNLGIIQDGSIFFTPRVAVTHDLDLLPFPDRQLTKRYHRKYHDSVMNRVALLMTSRGCPYRCNFCACWKLMDGKYAARSPESIVRELKEMPAEMQVVYFSDDNTFHDTERMWKLNSLIKENRIRKKYQMYARADTITRHRDLFSALAENGLQFLTVGFESFRDADLDYYNKKTSSDTNNAAIRILKELNIHIMAHFIVRPEYDTVDFRELYEYVCRNNLFRPAFPVLTPLPGTELYEKTINEFQTRNFDYFDFAHSILPTVLPHEEFYRQLTNLYVKSYSPLRFIKHRINRLLQINRKHYFTSNTDGVTIVKLFLINLSAIAGFLRLRYSQFRP